MTYPANVAKTLLISGLAYGFAWVTALVVGLAAWTELHLLARALGDDTLAFIILIACAGLIGFVCAALALKALVLRRQISGEYFVRTWALLALAFWLAYQSIRHWPSSPGIFEGGNITLFTGFSLALLGILTDLVVFRLTLGHRNIQGGDA